MPDGKALISVSDFSGGEFGLLGEVHAPRNSFTGQNVIRLIDGSLCPRSGLIDLTPSGVPAGVVLGFGVHPYERKAWFIVGAGVYQFALDSLSPAVAHIGTLSGGAPTTRITSPVNVGHKTYISCYGDKVYVLDHQAGTVAAVAGSPGGRAVTLYSDRMVVAGIAGNENRLRFSGWKDFTRWPTAGYLDMGSSDYAITSLQQSYHQLVAGKEDGSWWVLGGVPPVNESFHELVRSLRAGDRVNAASRMGLAGGDSIWFVAETTDRVTHFAAYIPRRRALTPYSHYQPVDHLSLSDLTESYPDAGATPKVGVTGLFHDADVLAVCGGNSSPFDNRAFLSTRNTFTRHIFGKNLSGWLDGRDDRNRRVVFCDGGPGGAAAKFYSWSYDLDRPPFSGETFEAATDAGSAFASEFTLPEFIDPKLNEIALVGVVVDFEKWNHGFGGDNGFTVTVTPTHRDGSGDGTPKSTSFSEVASAASTTGTSDSRRLTLDAPGFASGFRVAVSDIVGCAIQRLHFFYDTRPVQGI